ncbi:hypothetical protein INE81_02050 [Bacteroides salyersiae]|nr:hypothetical protein INE81_01959 [Bacteroides salyersiae]QUT75590.1 hypothetical protein INE81_02050 [Bacteroides salyersiae]
MKKNIVIKLLGTLFIVSFFVLLFMRVNTDIYVWNYSDFSIPIDIQLKIDYENYVRKIIKLPMRPFNLNHSKQNKN